MSTAAESSGPEKRELKLEFNLTAEQSQWIVARVESHNGALAHTYVLKEDFETSGYDWY